MSLGEYKLSERSDAHGLLHTPEGVRDIYNSECAKKLQVEASIHEMLALYSFKDIETPTFEYFDIFNKERGTIASKEMYKFFDKEGNTLVLRPDFTPSIARCAAKYYKEEELPIRLCYNGNTFINNSRYQGKLKEISQIGAELINDDSVDADAEMIALVIEALKRAGLKEFQIEIGHADFMNGILEEARLDEEEAMEFKSLMEAKNLFGVEDIIASKHLNNDLEELILKLPSLFGNENDLSYAKARVHNTRSIQAIERLEQLQNILRVYGLEDYISFDLGMLSKYNYYTGIILKGYTYGTGDVIVSGGRYDNLLRQFGKEAPAMGFIILIDQLMLALACQNVEISTNSSQWMVIYDGNARKTAIDLVHQLRSSGKSVELMIKDGDKELDSYLAYASRNQTDRFYYVSETDGMNEINLLTKQKEKVTREQVLDSAIRNN
ncbi:MAG: ATP phosphoribosyltransferase regulatory subunit [bacterium]|nr:ATP phosphoribosyltransferase regulatory subunit [bacterium]